MRRGPKDRQGRCAGIRLRTALFLALVSLGLVAGQLARLGHMALVAHAICEHGELTHQRRARVQHAAVHGRDAAVTQGDGVPGADHDHCDALFLKSPALAVAPSFVVPTLLDAGLLPWSVRPRTADPPIAILAFAPKGSPPV